LVKPEEKAREAIDKLLVDAGWAVQDYKEMNLSASLGVAVREFPLRKDSADYLLLVDRKPVGVVEAKPFGTTLSGVETQSEKYLQLIPASYGLVDPPPFAYESTGKETYFRDSRDPHFRSRRVFAFHNPETLQEWSSQEDTLRGRLRQMPDLITEGLRACQKEAIVNLEKSFAKSRPRALIQMATGSGKTFAAVSFVYRLIKFAGAKRILFLVDRNNLGRQTFKEFQQYRTPDDNRLFTELYNIQHLTSNNLDPVSRVCISTIQRVYSMLSGEEVDEEAEEYSLFEESVSAGQPKTVVYNSKIPIESFDFIITDECHRSIYNLWRQVLEYFDAFLIGLTATPSKQTLGFFNKNLVMEYNHERAIADGVNVGYEVYRINTKISQKGSKVKAGFHVDKRDKLTRERRWEQLDENLEYEAKQLDRDVVAEDQIRTIIRTFKEKLPVEIFPGRKEVPKTLVFAKDDSHAEDIVRIVRDEFDRGNEFCKKITYKTTGEKTDDLIASFRNSYNPRIAVSVDMISTGTDIKPLECLLFMRDIKSRTYFEQMKGRGTRTISSTDLQSVTPDTKNKTHFIIVDAIGVTENDKTDSRPLEKKRTVPFEKLLMAIARGKYDTNTISSFAGRLARLDRQIDAEQRKQIQDKSNGKSLGQLINGLLDAVDPDKRREKAKELFNTEKPSKEQVKQAGYELAKEAAIPFDNPVLRKTILEIRRVTEQIIDTVSIDTVTFAGFSTEQAQSTIESFKSFIEENKDELTALQIIYSKPYKQKKLTYEAINELAEAIKKPPHNLTPELVWLAYQQLEKSKVKGATPEKLLTDIISLVKFTIGENNILEPFSNSVNRNFKRWLTQQEAAGKKFTTEQKEWLNMIKDHITTSLTIEIEDFENVPFNQKGGAYKATQIFGTQLNKILQEMNTVLV
jgi:type I restriction enzyme, R subunit